MAGRRCRRRGRLRMPRAVSAVGLEEAAPLAASCRIVAPCTLAFGSFGTSPEKWALTFERRTRRHRFLGRWVLTRRSSALWQDGRAMSRNSGCQSWHGRIPLIEWPSRPTPPAKAACGRRWRGRCAQQGERCEADHGRLSPPAFSPQLARACKGARKGGCNHPDECDGLAWPSPGLRCRRPGRAPTSPEVGKYPTHRMQLPNAGRRPVRRAYVKTKSKSRSPARPHVDMRRNVGETMVVGEALGDSRPRIGR